MTAVEWLIEELKQSKHYQKMINEVNQSSTEIRDVIGEAKKMEHKIILDCVIEACNKPHIAMSYYWEKLYGKKY
jgi:hypothetical protein